MKDSYFGDINDYYKYGLIRAITDFGEMQSSICWMLTEGKQSKHGGRLEYLLNPDPWSGYDPELFTALREIVVIDQIRGVRYARERSLIPAAIYFEKALIDDQQSRSRYFRDFGRLSAGVGLLFFDPDNGMEIPSVPRGRKGSSKYLYWDELQSIPPESSSILIYQHFPRVERERFISEMADRFLIETRYSAVFSFRTAYVVFFLLARLNDVAFFQESTLALERSWNSQFEVKNYMDA